MADLRGIALGCVAAEQPAGQCRDELGQFRVHGGGRGGLFVAHTRPHGARGLRGVLESVMTQVMFDVPSNRAIQSVRITKDAVDQVSDPIITLRASDEPKALIS